MRRQEVLANLAGAFRGLLSRTVATVGIVSRVRGRAHARRKKVRCNGDCRDSLRQ